MNKIYSLEKIETPRLIIRPVKLGDEIPLNKAVNNSLELLQKWQSWAKDPSIDATRSFIQHGVLAWKSASIVDFPMIFIHKKDQKIIGASGYNDPSDPDRGIYEIGYWCDVNYQGQGLVTECANALTRYAINELAANKVVISMQVKNVKSIAVAERLQFKNEGKRPSRTKKNIDVYFFTCSKIEHLPPLEVFWEHR